MTKLLSVPTSLSDLDNLVTVIWSPVHAILVRPFYVFFKSAYSYNSVVCCLPIKTDMSSIDFDLDFVDFEEEEEGLDENEEGEGVNQPLGGEKSNKCNQCDYASSRADSLRTHLKTHSGEKSNKCNQCDYASFHAYNLRKHFKTHTREKSNKCSQCDFACSTPSSLRSHMKRHRQM